MKTIFNTYILLTEGQEQADRLKKVCIDNGLPVWNHRDAFVFDKNEKNLFEFVKDEFYVVFKYGEINNTQVTESEWLELLEEYKLTLK